MLGNKSDLPEREVPYNVAMEFARTRNFGYLEVSAKTGMCIQASFNLLVKCILALFIRFRNLQGIMYRIRKIIS